jgi:hypothetical protein
VFHAAWVFGGLPNNVSDSFNRGYYFTPGFDVTYLFSLVRYFSLGAEFDYLFFWQSDEDDYSVTVNQFRLGPELPGALPLLDDRLRLFLGVSGGFSANTGSWKESDYSGRIGGVEWYVKGLLGAEVFWGVWGLAINARTACTMHTAHISVNGYGEYFMWSIIQLHVGCSYRF